MKVRRIGTAIALLALLGQIPHVPGVLRAAELSPKAGNQGRKAEVRFERNEGQVDSRVDFVTRGPGHTAFLTGKEALFALAGEERNEGAVQGDIVRVRLSGSNADPVAEPGPELPGVNNYFLGSDSSKWVTGARSYASVRYRDVYPGIDLVYYGNGDGDLEYDFVVEAGSDPGLIAMEIAGGQALTVEPNGDLLVSTANGRLIQQQPVVYQEQGGARRSVEGRYVVDGRRVAFGIGEYDPALPLVIDPVLTYSTYLGGSSTDEARAIAVDGADHAVLTGRTLSIDFPVHAALDEGCGTDANCDPTRSGALPDAPITSHYDAFITKMSPDGSTLVSSTYMGGRDDDGGLGVAIGGAGEIYVTGYTGSADFPTEKPLDPTCGVDATCTSPDAFVAKLSANGEQLLYSTYLGGSGSEQIKSYQFYRQSVSFGDNEFGGIALDAQGTAYVTGATTSADFPGAGPATGPSDAFIAAISSDGSRLKSSRVFGGSGNDFGTAVAISANEPGGLFVYVTGWTSRYPADPPFPTTPGALRTTAADQVADAFITKLHMGASPEIIASTLLGDPNSGIAADYAMAIAIGTGGEPHITGWTHGGAFPVCSTPLNSLCSEDAKAALQPAKTRSGSGDHDAEAFVTKLNPELSRLQYSSYLGGVRMSKSGTFVVATAGHDVGRGIVVDRLGRIFVTGYTNSADHPTSSIDEGFPTSDDALQPDNLENSSNATDQLSHDAFLAVVDTGLDGPASLVYSSLLGGAEPHLEQGREQSDDFGTALALDSAAPPSAYVTGWTRSRDFPWVNAVQPVSGGGRDAFVTKVSFGTPAAPMVTGLSPVRGRSSGGTPVTIHGTGFTAGATVLFGDRPASVVTSGPNAITVTSPPHLAGQIVVRVRSSAGTSPPALAARYSFHDGAWTSTGALAVARRSHTATRLADGRVLVVGGVGVPLATGPNVLSSVELFDPGTGTWSSCTLQAATRDCPAPLNIARHSQTATLLGNGKVLVTGGGGLEAASLLHSCDGQSVDHLEQCAMNSAELYDPATGNWERLPDMTIPRRNHAAAVLSSGEVLISGGVGQLSPGVHNQNTKQNQIERRGPSEIFDPVANDWKVPPGGPLRSMRQNFTATPLPDGRILAAGGSYNDTPSGSAARPERVVVTTELYDPATGAWNEAGSHGIGRHLHSASALEDGKVLVTGGWSGGWRPESPIGASEIFDPAAKPAEAWSVAAALLAPRSEHSSVMLPGGRVLVTGGKAGIRESNVDSPTKGLIVTDTNGERRSNAEVFYPGEGAGRWVPAAPLLEGRARHTSTLLQGGRVLIVGGLGSDGRPLKSAELYAAAPMISAISPATGPAGGGTAVTLAGFGFTDDLPDAIDARGALFGGVAFGDAAAPLVGAPANDKLVVTTPRAEGEAAVPVTVLTETGFVSSTTTFAYTGLPAAVGGFSAEATSGNDVLLRFLAAGVVGDAGPPASAYVVRKSRSAISATNLEQADRLCEEGVCRFVPGSKGQPLTFSVGGLIPETTYFFSVQALDDEGNVGPASMASARTLDVIPGAITDLAAVAVSDQEIQLTFAAPGANGDSAPPVGQYVVKQSSGPIAEPADFAGATSLCGGICSFQPAAVGERLTLSVKGLRPANTYHFAAQPVDVAGNLGPISNTAIVKTLDQCRSGEDGGQVVYPAGYSLVGLPEGSVVPAQSSLYSWFNRSEGAYDAQDPRQPVSAGRGYWAWFSCLHPVQLRSMAPASVRFDLDAYKASMVGNPSGASSATLSGHDFAATWDPTLNGGRGGYRMSSLRQPVSLAVGEGAWAFSYRPTTLTIDAR